MKVNKATLVFMTIGLFICSLIGTTAAEASNGLKFNVKANIPENQHNPEVTYFDLMMSVGQTQEISVTLKNNTDEEVIILPKINAAMTNSDGVVEYSNFNNKERIYDKSLQTNIEEIVTLESDEVVLAPQEERTLKMTIQMPDEEVTGVIAGGIYLSQKYTEEKNDKASVEEGTSTNLRNLFGYQIALLLRNNDNLVTPEVVYEGAEANQLNARNAVSLKTRNSSPTYINQAVFKAKIKRAGSDETVAEVTKEKMQFAPNTIFDLYVPMQGKQYEAGDYVLTGSITSGNNEWPIKEEFTVTREQANKFNEADPDVEPEDYTMVIVLAALVAVFALAAVYLIRKNKQQKALLKQLNQDDKNKE